MRDAWFSAAPLHVLVTLTLILEKQTKEIFVENFLSLELQ